MDSVFGGMCICCWPFSMVSVVNSIHLDFQGPPTMGPLTIRIPKDMGIVWEAYHKGILLLGVPGITLDL